MKRGWAALCLAVFVIAAALLPLGEWFGTLGSSVQAVVTVYVLYRYLRGDRLTWHRKIAAVEWQCPSCGATTRARMADQ